MTDQPLKSPPSSPFPGLSDPVIAGVPWRNVVIPAVLIVAFLWWSWVPAPDDPVTAEAKSYLLPCAPTSMTEAPRACEATDRDFLAAYRGAYAGDRAAEHQVAILFMEGRDGLPRNELQGCAWAILWSTADRAHLTVDLWHDVQVLCAPLGPDGWQLALHRAAELRSKTSP